MSVQAGRSRLRRTRRRGSPTRKPPTAWSAKSRSLPCSTVATTAASAAPSSAARAPTKSFSCRARAPSRWGSARPATTSCPREEEEEPRAPAATGGATPRRATLRLARRRWTRARTGPTPLPGRRTLTRMTTTLGPCRLRSLGLTCRQVLEQPKRSQEQQFLLLAQMIHFFINNLKKIMLCDKLS